MRVVSRNTFRSKPFVNITDDSIRVTLDMTIPEWRKLQKIIKAMKTDEQSSSEEDS